MHPLYVSVLDEWMDNPSERRTESTLVSLVLQPLHLASFLLFSSRDLIRILVSPFPKPYLPFSNIRPSISTTCHRPRWISSWTFSELLMPSSRGSVRRRLRGRAARLPSRTCVNEAQGEVLVSRHIHSRFQKMFSSFQVETLSALSQNSTRLTQICPSPQSLSSLSPKMKNCSQSHAPSSSAWRTPPSRPSSQKTNFLQDHGYNSC